MSADEQQSVTEGWLDQLERRTLKRVTAASAVGSDLVMAWAVRGPAGAVQVTAVAQTAERHQHASRWHATLAPGNVSAYAYEPWPHDDGVSRWLNEGLDVLDGRAGYEWVLDTPSQHLSSELLYHLTEGGEHVVWDWLERAYGALFTPSPSERERERAEKREAYLLATARMEGAQRAAEVAGPPLLFIDRRTLIEKGMVESTDTHGLFISKLELDGLWLAPEFARAHGLIVPQEELHDADVDTPRPPDQA